MNRANLPKAAAFLVAIIVINLLLVGALNGVDVAVSSTFGGNSGELLYAGLFLALTFKVTWSLVRRSKAETSDGFRSFKLDNPDIPVATLNRVWTKNWLAQLPLVTLGLVWLTSLTSLYALDLFYAAPRDVPFFDALYLDPHLVVAGQLWRLVSVTLVHANVLHLAFNMIALWWLGATEHGESRLGHARFFFVYVACAIVASIASIVLTGAPAVGASGAIMGLVGILLVRTALDMAMMRSHGRQAAPTQKLLDMAFRGLRSRLEILALIAGATLLSGPLLGLAVGEMVDNSAHAGGLVAGALIALVFYRRDLLTAIRHQPDHLGKMFVTDGETWFNVALDSGSGTVQLEAPDFSVRITTVARSGRRRRGRASARAKRLHSSSALA